MSSALIEVPAANRDPRLVRHGLANGLRVLVAPVPDVSAVGITVCYDVGYRTESSSGLAHLFEHLMFTGNQSSTDSSYIAQVRRNGGICNATTHRDFTSYYEVLPPQGLELGLFLEAERMRGLRLEQRNLDNQVKVVGEEIRRKIENRPYGRFPWVDLPSTLFSSFANTHNGYGDVKGLQAVTLQQCEKFFADHYCPANAVLVVAGPVDPEHVLDLVESHFGSIPPRSGAARVDLSEPAGPARHLDLADPLAAAPALSLGWRLPPVGSSAYYAAIVLASVLADGATSVLHRSLIHSATVTQVNAAATLTGGVLETRDAEVFTVSAVHPATVTAEAITAEIQAGLRQIADGIDEVTRLRALRRLQSNWYADFDPIGARARRICSAELLYGDGELVAAGPHRLASVTAAEVSAAAEALLSTRPGMLRLHPAVPASAASRAQAGTQHSPPTAVAQLAVTGGTA